MPDPAFTSARQALLVFHYGDRLKSEFLMASHLLNVCQELKEAERLGGLKILLEYFRALEREVGLGQALIADPEMVRVRTVMTGLVGMVEANHLVDMQNHLTWVISTMTTYAQRAMEYLIQGKLL
jgi:hypothetical protein